MLKIYGASDDIVTANVELESKCPHCGQEVEEPGNAVVGDKVGELYPGHCGIQLIVGDQFGGVVVMMLYGANAIGCWSSMIALIEEDVPIPWDVRVKSQGYTVIVEVDCPNGTPIDVIKMNAS